MTIFEGFVFHVAINFDSNDFSFIKQWQTVVSMQSHALQGLTFSSISRTGI